MPMFEDREKVAEREFEQERESAFKLRARRNKLLGMWAAGRMGLVGAARTTTYERKWPHSKEERTPSCGGKPAAAPQLDKSRAVRLNAKARYFHGS